MRIEPTVRDRVLTSLADFICRRPWLVVIVGALLSIASIVYASTSLRLNANLDDLISRDRPYVREYRRFVEEFGDLEYILIAIDASHDRAAAERAADALLTNLRAIPGLPDVHGVISPEEQRRIATRAMNDEQLREFALAAGAYPALRSGDALRVLNEADATLNQLIAGGLTMSEAQQQSTGASAVLMLKAVAAANTDGASHRELASLIDPPAPEYLRSETGRLLFINILPVKDYSTLSVIEEPLAQIREAIAAVRREFPGVDIGLTGKPVLQYDEMATSNDDMTKASIIAFVLCAILFMLMIGGVKRSLLAVIAFSMGAAWTYGFATLAVGQLNLLSLVFMLVLVGVGLDYGVHVISRYHEFRKHGSNTEEALRGAIVTAVKGNITGALTSSVVFFMAFFTTFQGLRELGLIAGGGLMLCLIAMSVVLPALLAIVERRKPATMPEQPAGMLDEDLAEASRSGHGRSEAWFVRHARGVLVGAAIITLAFIFAPISGHGLRFEFNLLKLQAEGLESINWERRILDDSAAQSWFGAAIAKDQTQARKFIARAKERPTIGRVRSVFDVIQPDSPQRDTWRAALHATEADSPGLAPDNARTDLTATLAQAIAKLQLVAQGAALRAPDDAKQLSALVRELQSIDLSDDATRQSMNATLAAIAISLNAMLEGDQLPLREAMPAAVRDQFIARDGRLLVMLHPKDNVWELAPMQEFVADLRAVDANVTGVPITHIESLGEMLRAFIVMSILALLAIIALLAMDFRSSRDVLLALTPLIVGLVWTVEAMGLLGLSFNLANFFAVPMLIGLGVDSAVHILHRYHEGDDRFDRLHLGHTRRAVILTALTTIIGFGALVIAHHRGLYSLGLIMAIGSAACMISSIIILPALLAWRERSLKARA